ncbi:hypothetical protein B0J11DRAFT_117608 [Dendryphion nanum]|uniref:Secreted protein n=1 Tax=Dendryphion nanum TaxID=256645 RepID=A0A9P9DC50_9PLEO|nr:hypothetical protein B0J11DRAFT_117608 [Dendryphion nanum]
MCLLQVTLLALTLQLCPVMVGCMLGIPSKLTAQADRRTILTYTHMSEGTFRIALWPLMTLSFATTKSGGCGCGCGAPVTSASIITSSSSAVSTIPLTGLPSVDRFFNFDLEKHH